MTRQEAVAEALRQAASWGDTCTPEVLLQVAEQVEHMADDDPCCPLCEETVCDNGCALAGLRIWT